MELAIVMGIVTALCNLISADNAAKSHHSPSSGSHGGARSGNPVPHSFSYTNFGKHNPVINERSAKVGHNQQGDKLAARDTASASSYSQSSQQPDPSIALLPRGDQEGSLFGKETGSVNPFSGSSTSETGFGGSQLGFQQGVQLPGFPSTFGSFTFSPSDSPPQGISTGRSQQQQQGASIARYPQGFPLGGFATYGGGALGGFPQGIAVAGFPQGTTFGGYPQTATFGAFAPTATLTGFPYGAALAPVPGAFIPAGAPTKGQQVTVRGTPYHFAAPAGFPLYSQVPAQAYQRSIAIKN